MAYDIGQVTNMFDTLSTKVINELDSQFTKGRIKGTDYANAYAALLSTIIQVCVDVPLKDKQAQELEKNVELKNKQMQQIEKDLELKDRQIQGFDDKIRTDLFKTQMDTWGMMFSSGMLDKKPDIITNDETSTLYNDIKNKLR